MTDVHEYHRARQSEFTRFKAGDKVFVRDKGASKEHASFRMGGYRIIGPVTIQEVHYHPGREPFYPHGEGYSFNYNGVGDEAEVNAEPGLWWDCYPGCRVYATREEALAARMTREWVEKRFYSGNFDEDEGAE